MKKLKAALIATGFMPSDMDAFEALEKLAAMGYKGYEMIMMACRDGKHPLTSIFSASPNTDIPALIEESHKLGVSRSTAMVSGLANNYFMGPSDAVYTYDMAMKEIEQMEKIATELKKEGIVACFHNHHLEFTTCFKGVPLYYLMAANSENLKFELDCGWATYAGFDPVQIMKQLGNRLCAIHIKDFTDGEATNTYGEKTVAMPRFTTPGTGKLKMKDCLQQALDMGIEYAIIEQDFMYHLDPLATAQAGYYNMKETGLVE